MYSQLTLKDLRNAALRAVFYRPEGGVTLLMQSLSSENSLARTEKQS